MSFVTIQPVVLAAATGDLPTIGTAVSARNTAVCAPTTGVLPPAANDVSVLTAARFTAHTKHYRVVSKPPRWSMACSWPSRRPPPMRMRPPRPSMWSRPVKEVAGNGFRAFTSGSEFKPNVFRSGAGVDASRRGRLGRCGRGVDFRRGLVWIGGVDADR